MAFETRMNRRGFIAGTFTAATVALRAAEVPAKSSSTNKTVEIQRARERLNLDLVWEFVRVAHNSLPRTKELVEREPTLVLAAWDWGGGDWETGLGGASHIGSREIALYLLSKGARIDAFCAA